MSPMHFRTYIPCWLSSLFEFIYFHQNGKQEEDIPIDREDSDEGAEENITKRKRKNPGAESKKVKRKESAKKLKKTVDKRTTGNVIAASGGHSNETDADDIVEDFQFSSDDD